MDEKKYFRELNVVRGIAVLLVAMGHSFPDLQTGMKYPIAILIKDYIYDFHMAVFFFISGFFCLTGVKKYTFIEEIRRKVERLLIPYFFYSFISIILKLFFNKYANNQFEWSRFWRIFLGDSPNAGLWFLWTLFFVWLTTDLLIRIKLKSIIIFIVGLILNISQLYLDCGFFMYFMKFFVFYAIGILIYQNYDKVSKFLVNRKNIILSLVGFMIMLIFALIQTLNIIGEEFYIVTGMIGIFSTLQISTMIANGVSKLRMRLEEYGKYSYDIYLVGYYPQMIIRTILDKILSINYVIVCVSMFIGGFYIALYFSKHFLRKTKFLKKIFLGI